MAAELLTPSAGGEDLHLPPEIRREILTRLPAKSILRFRSVCKAWYSLVSCPNFISDHKVRTLDKIPNRLLLQLNCDRDYWLRKSYIFSSHDKSFMESCEHDEIPESFLAGDAAIVGSCSGLICLKKCGCIGNGYGITGLLIWNPTIRKIVELPSPTCTGFRTYFGFGFDSKTSDYKVLKIDWCLLELKLQIFDLRKGVWRDISSHGPSLWSTWCYIIDYCTDCYLDGAVHWSCDLGILLSFNFSDECFGEIKMPDCGEFVLSEDDGESSIKTKCVTFGGLIHVVVSRVRPDGFVDVSKSCSVWAMQEYGVTESWAKLFDIDLQSVQVLPSTKLRPNQLLFWETGKVLTPHDLRDDNGEYPWRGLDWVLLLLHDAGSQNSKCSFLITRPILDLRLYEESLVLI